MDLVPEWNRGGVERKRLERAGVTYERAAGKAAMALLDLRTHITDARAAGMTIMAIADATGLSRPAVYRALKGQD